MNPVEMVRTLRKHGFTLQKIADGIGRSVGYVWRLERDDVRDVPQDISLVLRTLLEGDAVLEGGALGRPEKRQLAQTESSSLARLSAVIRRNHEIVRERAGDVGAEAYLSCLQQLARVIADMAMDVSSK